MHMTMQQKPYTTQYRIRAASNASTVQEPQTSHSHSIWSSPQPRSNRNAWISCIFKLSRPIIQSSHPA